MRILLPEQIPVRWATVFATLMLIAQVWEGTNFQFAILHFMYLVLWVFTFNLAGGFRRLSGAYVFWYGLLLVPIGTFIKVIVIEPGDSNCWVPNLTMLLYTVSMAGLCGAVIVVRKIMSGRRSLAEGLDRERPIQYREGTIGLIVMGMVLPFSYYVLPVSIYQGIRLLNNALPFAIIMATIYIVRTSGFRKTVSGLNLLPMTFIFLQGVGGFTKQGMILPWFSWLLALAYTRFRLRLMHIAVIAFMGWYSVYALTPVAQVGRNMVTENTSFLGGISLGVHLLTDIHSTREIYKQASEDVYSVGGEYFTSQVDLFWARLSRFPDDDRLISYTNQGHYVGWAGVRWNFINLIPHLLMPNKDLYAVEASTGNYYAREAGLINSSDTTTGISFSPMAEAFHIGGWTGVCLFLPLLWVLALTTMEMVCGDLRATPWGLVLAVYLAHVAPESGVDGLIQFITIGNLGMIFTILLASLVAPLIGTVFAGNESKPSPNRSLAATAAVTS